MAGDNNNESNDFLVRFPGQREGEVVEFVLRKHPLTLLAPAISLVFMLVLPFAFYLFIIPRALPGLMYEPYSDVFFLLLSIFYGFVWVITFTGFSDYYLDILLVTNKRIMNIEQRGLFHRVVSELELERIQDITTYINGPVQTLFDYGDMLIQTASEQNKMNPTSIPHPVKVRRRIMELCEAMDEPS